MLQRVMLRNFTLPRIPVVGGFHEILIRETEYLNWFLHIGWYAISYLESGDKASCILQPERQEIDLTRYIYPEWIIYFFTTYPTGIIRLLFLDKETLTKHNSLFSFIKQQYARRIINFIDFSWEGNNFRFLLHINNHHIGAGSEQQAEKRINTFLGLLIQ